ncbi:MAG: hypothetical protein JKY65_18640, partial [Planctomycetes bacterium]|nr:hypothetical protein [Planctomycetota bacterium]
MSEETPPNAQPGEDDVETKSATPVADAVDEPETADEEPSAEAADEPAAEADEADEAEAEVADESAAEA